MKFVDWHNIGMDTFIVYIFNRVVFRISAFLRHWYVGGFFWMTRFFISLIERMDKSFALRVTLRNLFQPLYQDRSPIGYILGFVFRLFRLAIGIVVYVLAAVLGLLIYLLWAAAPLYLLFKATGGNFKALKWI